MRAGELEAWVLEIADRVARREPLEDFRVELKAAFPGPKKAARRLAAQGNASGGDRLLWIIGLDETRGVVGADGEELSNWLSGVRAEFEGPAPELERNLTVPTERGVLVALLFSSERLPFVVKNPDGGAVQYEVPWREGNGTRTARRGDLLRMLVPTARAPEVEVLRAELNLGQRLDGKAEDGSLRMQFYITPRDETLVTIPFYRCSGRVRAWVGEDAELSRLTLAPPRSWGRDGTSTLSRTIEGTREELLVYAPGSAWVDAGFRCAGNDDELSGEGSIEVRLSPIGMERTLELRAEVARKGSERFRGHWVFEDSRVEPEVTIVQPIELADQNFENAPEMVKRAWRRYTKEGADQRFVHEQERAEYQRRGYFAPLLHGDGSPRHANEVVAPPASGRERPGPYVWMVRWPPGKSG